jgi:hypothetical protein
VHRPRSDRYKLWRKCRSGKCGSETKNRQGGAPEGECTEDKVHAASCQRGTICAFRRSAAPHSERRKEIKTRMPRASRERTILSVQRRDADQMGSRNTSQDGHRFRVEAGRLVEGRCETGPCACYLTRTPRMPIDTPRICLLTTLRKTDMNPAFSRIAYGSFYLLPAIPSPVRRVNVRSWDKSSLLGHPLGQHKSWADKNLSSFVPLSHCPAPRPQRSLHQLQFGTKA